MVKKLNIKESLGVPDYYGLYIEPDNDDGFIIYNREKAVIDRMIPSIRSDWFWLRKEDVNNIRDYLNEENILAPSNFNEIIGEDDINYTDFSADGSIYFLDNEQIRIVKSFV